MNRSLDVSICYRWCLELRFIEVLLYIWFCPCTVKCVFISMYVCVDVCMYVCVCACECVYVSVCLCVCLCLLINVWLYVCMGVLELVVYSARCISVGSAVPSHATSSHSRDITEISLKATSHTHTHTHTHTYIHSPTEATPSFDLRDESRIHAVLWARWGNIGFWPMCNYGCFLIVLW